MMVKLGFEDEWNEMNEAVEKEIEEEARNLENEDADDYFAKVRECYEGRMEEIKKTVAFFQEGLAKAAPAEKAQIEMILDYLEREMEELADCIAEVKLEEVEEVIISEADGEHWVLV